MIYKKTFSGFSGKEMENSVGEHFARPGQFSPTDPGRPCRKKMYFKVFLKSYF